MGASCPIVKITPERLADLNTPRDGHALFSINGELTVLGGHTSGFKPTATAEYLSDGKWHQIPTVYTHDLGISLELSSGQVLLGGGCKDNLGSSQHFEAEMYDPVSHKCTGFGCLAQKRTLGSAIELDSGKVMITGNWYSDDCIEMFDGRKFFTKVKDVTVSRLSPYLFRTTDDILIIGDRDAHGNIADNIVVDRLHGEPFTVPLLARWRPMVSTNAGHSNTCFIGDEAKRKYAYLMPVSNFIVGAPDAERQGKTSGQIGVMLVEDTVFTLLPTARPIPMTTAIGGPILYFPTIIGDVKTQQAYLYGFDKDKRLYLVCIEYARRPAPLTLYYTDPLPDCGMGTPVLTDDGNLVVIGGCVLPGFETDNFQPVASTWLLRINGQPEVTSTSHWWIWITAATTAVLAIAGCTLLFFRRRKHTDTASSPQPVVSSSIINEDLMLQIDRLMTEQQLFLRRNLKVADIAVALNTNSRYISDCIKQYRNCTFSDFLAQQRVSYAQQLMQNEPEKKIAAIASESGFSGESSFFRTFKSVTGKTPAEWRNQ